MSIYQRAALTFRLIPFINTVMAIRRCPYCKAIIDESQKYCNNCGTQLLFPEDEQVEEDIKGDKIVDEDFKDSEAEFEESLEAGEEEDDDRKEEIDLEKVLEGGASFPGEEKMAEDEVRDEEPVTKVAAPVKEMKRAGTRIPDKADPHSAPKPRKKPEPKAEAAPEPQAESGMLDKIGKIKTESAEKPKPKEKKAAIEEAPKRAPKTPVIEEREVQALAADEPPEDMDEEPEPDEDREDEDDQQGESKPDTDTREEIVRLIAALEKKHNRKTLSKDEEKILAPLAEAVDIPPWEAMGREAAPSEVIEEEREEKSPDKDFAPGDTVDFEEEVLRRTDSLSATRSTIGIPETVTKDKTSFPFNRDDEELENRPYEAGEIEKDVEEEVESPALETSRARLGFFGRLTAVVFDLIFVALMWLGAAWLAARLMDVPIKTLVTTVPVPFGIFYLVLLVGYFFLFFFFMGETLGGRLSSPRD